MEFVKDMSRRACHDCAAKVGDRHLPGCDMERCPKCGGQLIGCSCFHIGEDGFDEIAYEKAGPEVWSGIAYEKEKVYCEKNNLYSYFEAGKGWVKCDSTHPEASHDINTAIGQMAF